MRNAWLNPDGCRPEGFVFFLGGGGKLLLIPAWLQDRARACSRPPLQTRSRRVWPPRATSPATARRPLRAPLQRSLRRPPGSGGGLRSRCSSLAAATYLRLERDDSLQRKEEGGSLAGMRPMKVIRCRRFRPEQSEGTVVSELAKQ